MPSQGTGSGDLFHFLKGEGREKERERNISQLPPAYLQLGTWLTT